MLTYFIANSVHFISRAVNGSEMKEEYTWIGAE